MIKKEEFTPWLETKGEYREQYSKKKAYQKGASERRKIIREIQEERDWS
jgi:hypothetical protein